MSNYDVYNSWGRKIGTIRKEPDFSGCIWIAVLITILLFVVVALFLISPLILGVVLLISFFIYGTGKETIITAIAWVILSAIVPTLYYIGFFSIFDEYLYWLVNFIWVYYLFSIFGFNSLIFYGVYLAGNALFNRPEGSSNNTSQSKSLLIGFITTTIFLCCLCTSTSTFLYLVYNSL